MIIQLQLATTQDLEVDGNDVAGSHSWGVPSVLKYHPWSILCQGERYYICVNGKTVSRALLHKSDCWLRSQTTNISGLTVLVEV